MKTKFIQIKDNKNMEEIKEAASAIKLGALVLFPTETVYGIGADALNSEAVDKIFEVKGRKNDNPLIVHISDETMLSDLVKNISAIEKRLMEAFWPGPFTLILDKTDIVPMNVTAGLNTVGIRMPKNEIALKLIQLAGTPVAAPSANISGRPSGTKIEDIKEEFDGKVEYIIDGGMSEIGIESTVVRVDKEGVVNILRPGKITVEDIQKLGFEVSVDNNVLNQAKANTVVTSPGMKYRHYAPNTKCVLVCSKYQDKMIEKINEIILEGKTLVICKTSNVSKYKSNTDMVIPMGDTMEEISKNIFAILRQVDKYDVDLVVIEGVEKEGLGLAIMNRLIRACEYNIVEV